MHEDKINSLLSIFKLFNGTYPSKVAKHQVCTVNTYFKKLYIQYFGVLKWIMTTETSKKK